MARSASGWLFFADGLQWHHAAGALAGYMMGLGGALLAALALRRYVRHHVLPLGVPRLYRTFRTAGLALVAYAVLEGLIGPPAPFPLASVINEEAFEEAFVVPIALVRSVAGLVLAISMIRGLQIFDLETDRLIHTIEQSEIVAIERDRMARDLHDGVIQRLYATSMLAESLSARGPDTDEGRKRTRLISSLEDSISDLRSLLSGHNETAEEADLGAALRGVINQIQLSNDTVVDLKPMDPISLRSDQLSHVASFLRECLSNALRHAEARRVSVAAELRPRSLLLHVEDDGKGLPQQLRRGYGIRDMRDRARLLGGTTRFTSTPGKGTTVELLIPMEDSI